MHGSGAMDVLFRPSLLCALLWRGLVNQRKKSQACASAKAEKYKRPMQPIFRTREREKRVQRPLYYLARGICKILFFNVFHLQMGLCNTLPDLQCDLGMVKDEALSGVSWHFLAFVFSVPGKQIPGETHQISADAESLKDHGVFQISNCELCRGVHFSY